MKEYVIQVNNLSFGYTRGSDVIEDVSFSVPENSMTMLIGPNGSGKTTLLKLMLGLLEPSRGDVEIYGQSPRDNRGIIGYVPQKLSFDHTFPITVEEFLQFSNRGSKDGIFEMLESLDIKNLLFSRIGELSGGQLQRVLIARSLLGKPKILFLDEPVSGIDVGGEQNFYELIKEIQEQHKVTVVMVSHEVHLVAKMADQVICINKKMLCSGEPSEALTPDVVEKLYSKDVSFYTHKCSKSI